MNELMKLIKEYPSIFDIDGEKSEDLVEKAENTLGVTLPKSYKQFLMKFGMIAFGGREYYGVIHEDFENSGIPDAVWYNLHIRKQYDFPHHLVAVYNNNGVEAVCLDTSNYYSKDECAIVVWDRVHNEILDSANLSFIDYLLEIIEEDLDELKEDEGL
jgi:hypothetical protein